MPNPQSSLKIVVVEPRGKGGMIHYAYQLCSGFAMNDANVTLVTSTVYELENLPHNFIVEKRMRLWEPMQASSPADHKIGKLFQKFYKLIRRGFRGIRYIIEWIRLVLYLPKLNADFIMFGKIEFPFEAIFLKYLNNKGISLAEICHEFERRELNGTFIENWIDHQYNSAFENFKVLFFHAENNRDRFQELFDLSRDRLKIIDHGNENIFLKFAENQNTPEDLKTAYNLENSTKAILFFGLLSPSKGIPELLEAFSLVSKQNKDARLIIAGFPSKYVDPQEYIQMTADLGITDQTIFDLRYIPNETIANLMKIATAVIYPYKSSTQSGALQVAYTFGKPVIVTDVGGLPEVVDHQKSGIIVPPNDTPALAEAILSLLNNEEKAKQMGEYARQLSNTRFSWKTITAQIIDDISITLKD